MTDEHRCSVCNYPGAPDKSCYKCARTRVYTDERELEGKPSGWIQYKGTELCADFYCECGHHGHVDAGFAYFYRCSSCKKVWAVGASIRLLPMSEEDFLTLTGVDKLEMKLPSGGGDGIVEWSGSFGISPDKPMLVEVCCS